MQSQSQSQSQHVARSLQGCRSCVAVAIVNKALCVVPRGSAMASLPVTFVAILIEKPAKLGRGAYDSQRP